MKVKMFYLKPEAILALIDWPNLEALPVYGLPENSRIRDFGFDHNKKVWVFIVEHESFPEVGEGQAPEVFQPSVDFVRVQRVDAGGGDPS